MPNLTAAIYARDTQNYPGESLAGIRNRSVPPDEALAAAKHPAGTT